MISQSSVLENAESSAMGASGLSALVKIGRLHGLPLTREQLIHDNALSGETVSPNLLVRCARKAGLKAKAVRLSWDGLAELKRALPVIVQLKDGSSLMLVKIEGGKDWPTAILQDPRSEGDEQLTIERARFEEAWTGDVILLRRNYDLVDEEQPFSLGLILALIFRERRIVRDVACCALALSLFALAPIVFFRLLSDKVLYFHAMSTFATLCIVMGVVVVFETIFGYLRSCLLIVLTSRIDIRLSEYMFDKVLKLPISFFECNQVGKIGHDMNEVWRIRSFLTGQLFGTILDSLTLLLFLPIMFAFSPLLTLIVLALCGLIVAWLVLSLPRYRKVSGAVQDAEAARGAFLIQTLQGMRTVKSLALENRQRHIWDVHISRIAKLKDKEGFVAASIQTGVRPLERLAVSGTYALGVYEALTNNNPVFVGALFAFLMLAQRISGPLMQMAQLVNQYDEAASAVRVVGALVNQPKEEGFSNHGVRAPLLGHVAFSGVTFTYPGGMSPALKQLTFEVPRGTTLGIVGRSGSGKTTVTRLLQRLHSDYSGLIKIDGIDVREYDVAHLRRNLGVVLQDNYLFSGTIRENITAAKLNATYDEVVRAARLAGAEEFIERLPRGYETYIYEGSPNLSGGQRQRLAIARALILDPKVLILDEATSALDPDSEAIVNANIKRIAEGRTVIIISHRLSSLVNSDAILVLERGEFLDMANHEELLRRCEVYSGLWHQQNGHIEAAGARLTLQRVPRHVF